MKVETMLGLSVAVVLSAVSLSVYGYQRCERYEYAELKNMSAKQLHAEYCKAYERSNDMQRVIGETALDDERRSDQAQRDRDDCWDMMDKIQRQAEYKKIKSGCPGIEPVDPIPVMLERSREHAKRGP